MKLDPIPPSTDEGCLSNGGGPEGGAMLGRGGTDERDDEPEAEAEAS